MRTDNSSAGFLFVNNYQRLFPLPTHTAVRFAVTGRDGSTLTVPSAQVIPTPSRVLDRISPIVSSFPPVFCAFSPSRRGGSNEPQAGNQGGPGTLLAPPPHGLLEYHYSIKLTN